MNKHYTFGLVLLLAALLYTIETRAPCCGGTCYVGGKCCGSDWYIGCNYTSGVACPNDVFDDCIACECTSPTSCSWVAYGSTLCPQIPQCQVCTYDNLNNPSFSTCSTASDCSINGTCYLATQNANNSCCCDAMNCGADHIDETYAITCNQNGMMSGALCYYGAQMNSCTSQGWECQDSSSVNCTTYEDNSPGDYTLTRSIPTVDTCTSICNNDGVQSCCDITTVTCDSDCSDGFCVTATDCQSGPFNIGGQYTPQGTYVGGGVDYYCHNDNGVFYIDTNPTPPDETCDDGYNNNCDGTPDGVGTGCAGSCLLSSPEWSPTCAFENENVNLVVQGNEYCVGKDIQLSVFEDDDGSNDTTFGLTSWPTSPQTFSGTQLSVSWAVDREDSPDDEATEDMDYKFKAWITDSGTSTITPIPLIVKYCAAGDSDCDGEPDGTDECLETPMCAAMDEEASGCSMDQAKVLEGTYDIPGLGFNVLSFILAFLALTFLIVYNVERRV